MFTNGTGYQFHGGVFYNVAGDVNLQHHHRLTIEDRRRVVAPALQAPTSGPKDVKRLPTVQAGEFDGRNAESEDDLTGEARDSRRGMTAATAPYNASVPNAVASSDDDRLEEGHSTQYREAFHLPPMPSTQGATFFSANNVNTAQNIIYRHGESGIDILHRAVALEALYDSAESFMQRRCHPDTRKELLDDLYRWATQNDSAQPICWLHGPAGAGKSAVMQTLCEKLQRTSRLGGAFFFKRGHATRGNPRALFVTLAYQLALNNCELNPPISHVVKHDPSIVGRSMDAQLRQLIIEPCKSLKHSPAPILLLDGLDECDTHDAQLEILRLIGSVVRQYQNKFRIIVASRPEADIRDSLEMPSFAGILHSVNIEQSFDDVRTYLCDEFTRIHREHKHTMGGVPIPWPSTEILERLVYKSSGFIQ